MNERYCDDEAKCQNAGRDCDHCTRNYDYEAAGDCFVEKIGLQESQEAIDVECVQLRKDLKGFTESMEASNR